MPPILPIILLILATALGTADEPTRLWMSADGTRTFKGKFVQRDRNSVTFSIEPSGSQATIPADKIHPEDIKWLDANHPLPRLPDPAPRQKPHQTAQRTSPPKHSPASGSVLDKTPAGPAVFDTIAIGDSYQTVMRKLKDSKLTKASVPEALMGRTGLNGVYQTRKPLAGLPACLFFDWDDSNHLKELTLHSDSQPSSMASSRVTPGWSQLIGELTKLHGSPKLANTKLNLDSIPDGGISFTHVWRLPQKGSCLLGAANDNGSYQIIVRYTAESF